MNVTNLTRVLLSLMLLQLTCEVECDAYSVQQLIAGTLLPPKPSELTDEGRLSDLARMLEGDHRRDKSVVDAAVEGFLHVSYKRGAT